MPKATFLYSFFILFSFLPLFAQNQLPNDHSLNLTSQEKAYLQKKQIIRMCIDPDWMPFEKFDENGHYIGMTAEYFKLFAKELNVKFTPLHTSSWSESVAAAKQRKCDIFSLAMQTPERKKYMNFTTPYLSIPLVLATTPEVTFLNDFNALQGSKIGIVRGYAFNELIRKKYPNIHVIDINNLRDGLQKVINGELFGCIDTMASVGYMFQTEFMGELKITGKFDEKWELGIGVRNDNPTLYTIFEKVIKHISPQVQQEIFSKYIAIKYEKTTDYTLLLKVLATGFFIILIVVYHNRKLAKINKKLEKLQKKLEDQAHKDPLTNLYNRRYFYELASNILELEIREKRGVSIIMIDIDDFKHINDTHGHAAGDSIIKNLATLLLTHTRKSDVVARFGGEEFVILLPNTELKGAYHIASKLREVVEQEKIALSEDLTLHYTISIGVDTVQEEDTSIDNALQRADNALYKAKNGGKNQVATN